jgi:hypothetical protein
MHDTVGMMDLIRALKLDVLGAEGYDEPENQTSTT